MSLSTVSEYLARIMPEIASSSDDVPCPKCKDFLFPFPEDPELAREILRRVDLDSRCHGCDLLQHLPAESRSLTSPNSNEIPCSVCHDLLLPEALRFRHTYKEVRKSAELCVSCDLLQKLAEHLEPDESIREEAVFTLKVEMRSSRPARESYSSIWQTNQALMASVWKFTVEVGELVHQE
jgi:hypothetical protein